MSSLPARAHRARAALAALLLAAAALPCTAAAQSAPQAARIEGRVTDSVHARPLAGAIVQLARVSPAPPTLASVVTDTSGAFRFDSLVAGRYAISFGSPLMDSLGVLSLDREVVVAAGQVARVALAVPSGRTLRAVTCPGVTLAAGRGAIGGTVSSAGSEQPLAGGMVVVGWGDLQVDSVNRKWSTVPRIASVRTDPEGHYRLCDVPTNVPLQLQVQHAGLVSSVVSAQVPEDAGTAKQDISVSLADKPEAPAAAAAGVAPAAPAALPRTSGDAGVAGVILGTGGRPLSDAEVRIAGARGRARTDSLGRYTLSGQPAGTQMLEVQRLGYFRKMQAVELRDGRTTTLPPIRLDRSVTLDSIRIVAQRTRLREFEARRATMPFGRFLTEADILKQNPFSTGDIFRNRSGFSVMLEDGVEKLVSARGSAFDASQCETNVVIDGAQHMDINNVHPSQIAAIEMYPSASGAPQQYDSFCGLVVIWTKR